MKRMLALLLVLLLPFSALAERQETGAFEAFVQSYQAEKSCRILSRSEYGSFGVFIAEENGTRRLVTAFLGEDGWQTEFEKQMFLGEGASVWMDSEDILFLTNPVGSPDDGFSEHFCFERRDGRWLLSYAYRYEGPRGEWNVTEAFLTNVSENEIRTRRILEDENENSLLEKPARSLPNVLTAGETDLASFDPFLPPINGAGYGTDETGEYPADILRRLFDVLAPGGYAFADGAVSGDGLLFLADRPDGARVLLCLPYGDGEKVLTESSPLPAGTTLGLENLQDYLNLDGKWNFGVSVRYTPVSGKWGVRLIEGAYDLFEIGPYWAGNGLNWYASEPAVGDSPWSDITLIDWNTLPETLEEAKRGLDSSGWATPNNPDPEDRLHLREKPERGSASLGKYYNGAPVKVLERGKEWTRVRIGGTEGYMMTKYLAFGADARKIVPRVREKFAVGPVTEVIRDGKAVPEKIGSAEEQFVVIGVIDEEWYLVWDPESDQYSRVRQDLLWDGNG